MPRNPVRQTSFAAGQFSRKVQGRSEIEAYSAGASLLENFIAMIPGGAEVRPGHWRLDAASYAAVSVEDDTPVRSRMIVFQRSTLEGYVLELTAFKLRIWSLFSYALVTNPDDSVLEITTPWDGAAIRRLMWSRQADVMVLTDASNIYAPYVLANRSTGWTLNPFEFREGPFGPVPRNNRLTVSGTTSLTLTAQSAIFEAGHVGAKVWIKENPDLITAKGWGPGLSVKDVALGTRFRYAGRVYSLVSVEDDPSDEDPPRLGADAPIHSEGRRSDGKAVFEFLHDGGVYATITSVTSATSVSATLDSGQTLPNSVATTPYWHIQAFNGVDGWPSIVAWHDERVWFGGTITAPDTLFSSETNGYDDSGGDFKSGLGSGLVVDSDGIRRELANSTVDPTAWMISAGDLVVAGASGSRRLRGPATGEPLTPAGSVARNPGFIGVERGIPPVLIGKYIVFVELGGRRIFSLRLSDNEDFDLTAFSDDLLQSGVDDIAWEATNKTLWVLTRSGQLLSLVYDDKNGYQALTPHVMAEGALVETISVARRSDGFEALWMVLRRQDSKVENAPIIRDVCVTTRRWNEWVDLDASCYLDFAGYFDATDDAVDDTTDPDNPSLTPVLPPQAVPPTDDLDPGENYDIPGYPGFDPSDPFFDFNVGNFKTAASDQFISRLTGLTWLEGLDVRVIADGAYVGDFTVTNGVVDLPVSVVRGWVGLPYIGRLRTLPRDDGLGGVLSRNVKRSLDKLAIESAGIGGAVGFVYGFEGELTSPQRLRDMPSRRAIDGTDNAISPRDSFVDLEAASEFDFNPMVEVNSTPGFPLQIRTIEYWVQANAG